jgi:ATP-binding cassette subfamily B protein
MPLPPLAQLQVRDLAVQWVNGSYGIRGVDLDLAPGRLVVVTGAVGAGKTTLLRAVLGMLPRVEGDIIWNGEKITNPDLQLLPPAVACTSQVPRLFSDSIVENITQGRDVADSEMDEASPRRRV